MKIPKLAGVLTVINLVLLIYLLTRLAPGADAAPVVRAHSLEIVDDQGRVRAQIIVVPASTTADGQNYPETTLLRLIDPNGRPGVKISTSADGSGMTLSGDSEFRTWSGLQFLASAAGSTLKLTNKDGREQLISP